MIILSMFFTDHLQTHKLKKLTINLIKSIFFYNVVKRLIRGNLSRIKQLFSLNNLCFFSSSLIRQKLVALDLAMQTSIFDWRPINVRLI